MASFGPGEKSVICRFVIIFSITHVAQLMVSKINLFCQRYICRYCSGIPEEGYQNWYHVRKLKNGNGWLFLCDTWSRCMEKLQFMLMEIHQISNLRSQDVSMMILSDLVRKDVAEFSDKFSHFQYAVLEIFKAALNNYSVLKSCFFNPHPHFCNAL